MDRILPRINYFAFYPIAQKLVLEEITYRLFFLRTMKTICQLKNCGSETFGFHQRALGMCGIVDFTEKIKN